MGKWPLVRLGDVFDLQMGKTPSRDNNMYWDNGIYNWASISDLSSAGKYIETTSEKITDLAVKESGIKIVPENTVLLSFKLSLGKVCISLKSLYTNEAIMALLDKKVYSINIDYIYYLLKNINWDIYTNKAAKGKTLNKGILANIKIPLPPIDIQKHIANTLDKTQEVIDGYKKLLAELDNLVKSAFHEMFGDPAANEKEWEVKSLKEISEKPLSYGSGASATDYNGDVRYIRITDINDDGSLNRDVVSPNVIDTKYILNDGDILFARSGATVGKTLRFRESFGKCIYAGYLIRFVPKEKFVLPDYVYYYTKTNLYRRFIGSNIKTVAQPNINARQYGELKVVIPPLDLQNKFAEIVTKIDEQKALVKRAISESEHLFNSLMSEYFD